MSLIDETMSGLMNNINESKQALFRYKLKEMELLKEYEAEQEAAKNSNPFRFSKFLVEIEQPSGIENYYYNDGSKEGVRIVPFRAIEFNEDPKNGRYTLTVDPF